eukprot:TRINITY_DN4632_c0_g1_i1.p1 TRINITY_DN4632_c0_g1~~TRINITY_DN4632_c0_g1_i1.p1  ORF type:complete len:223 (+),score=52.01 TRINITY_DN4632_c0_g1_i1:172-840(+)
MCIRDRVSTQSTGAVCDIMDEELGLKCACLEDENLQLKQLVQQGQEEAHQLRSKIAALEARISSLSQYQQAGGATLEPLAVTEHCQGDNTTEALSHRDSDIDTPNWSQIPELPAAAAFRIVSSAMRSQSSDQASSRLSLPTLECSRPKTSRGRAQPSPEHFSDYVVTSPCGTGNSGAGVLTFVESDTTTRFVASPSSSKRSAWEVKDIFKMEALFFFGNVQQ